MARGPGSIQELIQAQNGDPVPAASIAITTSPATSTLPQADLDALPIMPGADWAFQADQDFYIRLVDATATVLVAPKAVKVLAGQLFTVTAKQSRVAVSLAAVTTSGTVQVFVVR
jgi:hypothetical protein